MDQKVSDAPYDVEAIRRDFPILSREVYGKPLVYLDNGASAQKPQAVLDAIDHAYRNEYANVHRGLHFLSNAATDAYEKARETVRRFLNAPSTDNIVFTSNTTAAINTVAYGFGMPHIGEGDEIVLSIMEHHSNIVPWHFIRERQGAKLVWVPVDDLGDPACGGIRGAPDATHQALRHHADVECAGHGRADQGDRDASPMHAVSPCWSTAARARSTCRSTCRISVAISSSSPATRSTDRRESACSMERRNMLDAMRPFQGGGEMIFDGDRGHGDLQRPAAPLRGRARRRSCRRSGSALRSTTWRASAASASPPTRPTCKTYAHDRLRPSIRCASSATRRRRALSFPSSCKGIHAHDVSMVIDRQGVAVQGGHALRPAAAAPVRRHLHLPGVVRHVQHARRGRCAGRSAGEGAQILRMTTMDETTPRRKTRQRTRRRRDLLRLGDPGAEELARLTDDIVAALKTVYDPEIPADIYELGLIYKIDIEDDRTVKIDMTLTAPGCPVAGEMPGWVRERGRRRRRRVRGRREHDVRSAVDAGSHVGGGPSGRRLVLTDGRRSCACPPNLPIFRVRRHPVGLDPVRDGE